MNQITKSEPVAKAAIRCSKCNKYRKHTEYTAPFGTDDDPKRPICDKCKAKSGEKAQKALATLDAVPVIALTPDGRERETTIAKALGNLAISQRDPIGNFGKMVASYRREWALEEYGEQLAEHTFGMVKAELSRRRVAALNARTADLMQKAEAVNVAKAAADDLLAKVMQLQDDVNRHREEIGARVAVVTANAERAYKATELQRCRIAAAAEARDERVREDWLFKAGSTTDPILRMAYMAKADGTDLDDDDD